MKAIKFMLDIGFMPNHCGLDFWLQFIHERMFDLSASEVYERISKRSGKSPAIVEEAMRSALTSAFNSGKLKRLNSYIGSDVVSECQPGNTELMSLLKLVDKFKLFEYQPHIYRRRKRDTAMPA